MTSSEVSARIGFMSSTVASPSSRGLPRGLAALRHRNYRLFFAGNLISVIGSWMQTTAQSWLVVSMTGSAFKLGLLNVCQFAPVLVLGLFAGVIVDRLPKRQLLIATQAASGLCAAILAILDRSGSIQLWQVYLIGIGIGIVNAFDMPARQTFVVEMVGKEDLSNAIALNSSVFNTGRLVGPAVAGALVAVFGTAVCFALNAVSFLAVIIGLLMMRITPSAVAHHGSGLSRLRQGLGYVRTTPVVFRTIALAGFVATFGMNFSVWVPLLAKQEYGVEADGFGILLSALGLGSLAGALVLAFFSRGARPGVMIMTASTMGLAELVLALTIGFSAPMVVGLILLPVMGFAMTATMSMANTTIQMVTPHELRGRVLSVYLTVFAGSAPFGALLAGVVANELGTGTSVAVGGSVTLLAAVVVASRSGILSETLSRRLPIRTRPRTISSR
jgi:MFS family permease